MKKIYTVLFVIWALPAQAQIKVIDGDSLVLDGRQIRLAGIDAPEYFQECYRADGSAYECGKESMYYLKKLINKAHEVSCKKKDIDRYERELCICKADGRSLNRAMVSAGHAVAYRYHWYDKDQDQAKKAKRGIWQGRFMRPELYRILKRENQEQKKS